MLFFFVFLFVSQSQKIVQNGDFTEPKLTGSRQLINSGIMGWTGQQIEIGKGSVYNSRYPQNFFVLSLDTGSNQVVSQTVQIPFSGTYKISFLFACYENKPESSIGVLSVGPFTKLLRVWDNGIHKQEMIFDVAAGSILVQFKGEGEEDCFGLTITQVQIVQYNAIVNCDFQYPSLNGEVSVTFNGSILGWVSNRTVLMLGTFQNTNWEDDIIVLQSVDKTGPIIYTQTFSTIPPNRKLTLSFSWAATMTFPSSEQSAKIVWNNLSIMTLTTNNYGVQVSTIDVVSSVTNSISIVGLKLKADSGLAFGKLSLMFAS